MLQGHLLWLEVDLVTLSGYFFNTDQRFFDFKINFLFEYVSSASRLLIICRVILVLYGDWPLIQNKGYYFEIKFLFGMYQVLQGHLLLLEVGMVILSGYTFTTDQRFFDFKINFLFEYVSSASRLLIISRVRHVFYGD